MKTQKQLEKQKKQEQEQLIGCLLLFLFLLFISAFFIKLTDPESFSWLAVFTPFAIIVVYSSYSIYKNRHDRRAARERSEERRSKMTFQLTGLHLPERKRYIMSNCKVDDSVKLKFEPDNEYDKNAIMVLHNGFQIGYVPAKQTRRIANFIRTYYYQSTILSLDIDEDFIVIYILLKKV